MKPTALLAGLAATFAAAGCSQFDQAFAPPPPSALSQPIPASEVEWSKRSGANTVSGMATMKAGDTTHTCAGQAANLIPDSAYARARMTAIFGNDTPADPAFRTVFADPAAAGAAFQAAHGFVPVNHLLVARAERGGGIATMPCG